MPACISQVAAVWRKVCGRLTRDWYLCRDADIKKAIAEGITPTGGRLSPPMPYPFFFQNMTPEGLDAVLAYVRTIPPIKNKVTRTELAESVPLILTLDCQTLRRLGVRCGLRNRAWSAVGVLRLQCPSLALSGPDGDLA